MDRTGPVADLATFFGIKPEGAPLQETGRALTCVWTATSLDSDSHPDVCRDGVVSKPCACFADEPATCAPPERDQFAPDAQEEPRAVQDELGTLDAATVAASAKGRLSSDEERPAAVERPAEPSQRGNSRVVEDADDDTDAAPEGRGNEDSTPSSGSKLRAEPTRVASGMMKVEEESAGCSQSEAEKLAGELQEPSGGATKEAGNVKMPPKQPVRSGPGRKPSPFLKGGLADLEERAAGGAESSGVDMPLSNQRLGGSLPVSRGSEPKGESMPRAMSADEASRVIEQAREAVEQVQRELQAMMPFMTAKGQNGQQTWPDRA